jgi:hypothetical protein
MPKKSPKTKPSALQDLKRRVCLLEKDFHTMKVDVGHLSEELAVMKISMKHVDERTKRGELVLLEMQGEQRKISRTLDRLAQAQGITPEPAPPEPTLEPGDDLD